MYQELKQQYERLTQEEKDILLLYKTKIGYLLNELHNNPDLESYYIKLFNMFSEYSELPTDLQFFSLIRLDSLPSFRESLYEVKRLLDIVSTKMVVSDPIKVFRSISSHNGIEGISKSNIISTSLEFGDTLKYAIAGDNISIYEIEVRPGSRLAYIPECDELVSKHKELFRVTSDEEEILLNKDIYDFETTNEYDNDSFKYIKVSATDIKNKTRI